MTRLLTATTLPVLLLAAPAFSQGIVFELDEIVFSGEFDESTIEETGATISVVTREELEQSAETRVIDYLARLPGVDVRARGPIGALNSVTLRGAGQNYVRVLVDGIDVTDVSGPQAAFDFGSLTTSDISRIELLRGGQSAIYGSEAIGGVISITSLRAEEDGVTQSVNIEGGSYESFRGSYSIAADLGALDYAVTLTRTQTEGFSAADENDGNTEADGFEANRLSFSLGYDLDNGARVGLNGFVEHAELEFDQQFPVSDGTPDEVSYNESMGLRAYLEVPTGQIDSTFAATYYVIERDVQEDSGFGFTRNIYDGERFGLSYVGALDVNPETAVRFGLDATREIYSQTGTFGPGSGESETVAVFGEVAWSPSSEFDLSATLRFDDHSQFGGLSSTRLAASWRPTEAWIVRSSLAQSFRAPSLYELYGPFGEPTLEPEESRSIDAGVERRFDPETFLRATVFYSETTNLVDFPFPYAQVPGTVIRRGVELEGGAPLGSDWRIDGNYTYTTGENPPLSAGNAWNLEFPEHDLSMTLTGDITERLSTALTVQAVWDRPTLADYTLVNATFSYDVTDDLEVYVRIDNVLDEEYQLFEGYGTSDRAAYIGIRAQF